MKKKWIIFFMLIANIMIYLLPISAHDIESTKETSFLLLQISICSVLILISILMFIIYYHIEKKENNSFKLSFSPPRKLPIALCSYIQYGNIDQIYLTPLILQWAQAGYIQIIEKEKILYLIKKVSFLKHVPIYEQTVFKNLFQNTSKICINPSNPKEQIKFWTHLHTLFKKEINNDLSSKIYRKAPTLLIILQGICISIPVFLIVFSVLFPFIQQINQTIFYALLSMIGICICYIIWGIYLQNEQLSNIVSLKYILAIINVLIIFHIHKLLLDCNINILYSVISFSSLLLIAIFLLFYKNRTRIGHLYLQDIWKTQNCILHIRYSHIKQQLQQNPQYYYQLLPYACALQIDAIWKAKFKSYSLLYPHWFSTTNITASSQEPIEHIHSCIHTLYHSIDLLKEKE